MIRLILIIAILVPSIVHSQGLFEYFKLTADDDGPEKFDRIGVDLNWDTWLNTPPEIETGYFSIGVNAHWYKDIPLGKRSHVALAIGLGIGVHNVHHNGELVSIEIDGQEYTKLQVLPKNMDWRKNKYSVTYVDIPFELRFRNMSIKPKKEDRKNKQFRFYPGFKIGLLVNDHTKWKDNHSKYKAYNLSNTLPYRYGVSCRVGFNKLVVHAFYSLTPIFEKGKGSELYPFSLGISWLRL